MKNVFSTHTKKNDMKTSYKWLAVCALGAAACLPSGAQRLTLTADDCRQMALEHNASIKNAKNDVDAAEQTRRAAFTNYFPTVSATGMGFNADKGTARMVLGEGMALSMLKNGVIGSVTAVQPVFAGGQIVNGNKLAQVGVDVSQIQAEQAENNVELTAEQYFWQVVTLEEKLRTVEAVDSMLQRLCGDVEAAVTAGVSTRNDLLQVQLKRNETASTRLTLQNGISVSRLLLAQYIGVDNTDFDLASGVSTDVMPQAPQGLFVSPDEALLGTPEYRLLQKNVEATKLQKKLTLGKQLPTVGIGAGYTYHNLMDNDRSFGMVFASVSIPISGWWGGSHELKKQKLKVWNAENDLTDNSELLVIRMQKAWNDVTDAYKQVALARQAIEQSTENLRLYNDYYKAGTTTMTDLLNAQTLYQQSRDKYAETCADYRIRTVEYLQATGR